MIASDKDLLKGLQQWKKKRLQEIEDHMIKLNLNLRLAQGGLAIAHRNPGDVAEDIIEYQWERLNRSATELEQLEGEHQRLMEMDLAQLIITYKQKRKEPPTWAYQNC